jgi:hypothetical protein
MCVIWTRVQITSFSRRSTWLHRLQIYVWKYVISKINLIQRFKGNVRKRDMKGRKTRKNMKAEDMNGIQLNFNGYFHQYWVICQSAAQIYWPSARSTNSVKKLINKVWEELFFYFPFNIMWHVNALPGNVSINTPRYAHATIGLMLKLVVKQQSASQWTGEIDVMWLVFCVVCATQQ